MHGHFRFEQQAATFTAKTLGTILRATPLLSRISNDAHDKRSLLFRERQSQFKADDKWNSTALQAEM